MRTTTAKQKRRMLTVLAVAVALIVPTCGSARAMEEQQKEAAVPLRRMGSVDLGILAETTPVVWKNDSLLLECIQGGRYYDNINYKTYPGLPQPPGYLRFVNILTGVRSKPFGFGYGLGNALVVDGRMHVFATRTPFGISSNNTEVSIFSSDDLLTWATNVALRVDERGMFPPGVTLRKVFNTCVRPAGENDEFAYVMAYEFNEPGVGWQTGFAVTEDSDLRHASWTCVPRPQVLRFATLAHANPTLRRSKDGWWYLISTRETHNILAQEIWRTKNVTSFLWEATPAWKERDVTAGALLSPSAADQIPVSPPWHPDTHSAVAGNKTALKNAENINVSDLDLCTITLPNGTVATIIYYAWGDQKLGPTAMVLSMAMAVGIDEDAFLASRF